MRRVLRQDPDVILIGEMRDEETVRTALSAAETGHLVLSTVHTLDATETINRIIDFFPPHLQQQARVMLSATLRGAIAQRLVPDITGEGRVPASEILVVTGRVQDLILNPEETGKITEVIAEGEYYGMRTFDQALLAYVMEGRISRGGRRWTYASSPHDFKLMLAAGGQRASGIEQLDEQEPVAPMREKLNSDPKAQIGLVVVLLVARRLLLHEQNGRRRRSEEAPPTEATVSVAGTEATGDRDRRHRRRSGRRRRRRGGRSRRRAKPPRPSVAALDPGAAAAAAGHRRLRGGKTVVLLVVHDGGIDDDLVTERRRRRSASIADVAALRRPRQADLPLRRDHARGRSLAGCRRWS